MTLTGSPEPAVPDGHNFAYVAPDRERIHLTQAFDDGSQTYLQFDDAPASGIEIRDPKSDQVVAYTVDERYLIVPGVYGALRVAIGPESATVVNQAMPSVAASGAVAAAPDSGERSSNDARSAPMSTVMGPEISPLPDSLRQSAAANDALARRIQTVPVGVPESIQTMHANLRVTALKQEISMLEENVRRLSAELESAHAQGFGESLYLRSLGGLPRLVMKFEDNSSEAQVDDRLLGVMGGAARSANRIYLHGHTDAFVASETGTDLAIRRTVEVRRLLISLNVDPERIRLFYRGAGNFVANNSTPEGKALNRRVEIELRKW
jgi:flagellar motor protein MotB